MSLREKISTMYLLSVSIYLPNGSPITHVLDGEMVTDIEIVPQTNEILVTTKEGGTLYYAFPYVVTLKHRPIVDQDTEKRTITEEYTDYEEVENTEVKPAIPKPMKQK